MKAVSYMNPVPHRKEKARKIPANRAFSPNNGKKARNAGLVGGGRSPLRTRLMSKFPANRELTGNFCEFKLLLARDVRDYNLFSVCYG